MLNIEQTKLTATALNNVAVSVIVTGVVVPAVAYGYGLTGAPAVSRWWLLAIAWFAGGVGLHGGARLLLRGLRS